MSLALVYPACTSVGRIRCFCRFSRLIESVTYVLSTSLLVRSPLHQQSSEHSVALVFSADRHDHSRRERTRLTPCRIPSRGALGGTRPFQERESRPRF